MKFLIITILLFSIIFYGIGGALAVSDSADVKATVTSECNNNGVCETDRLENELNCPADCYVVPPIVPTGGGINSREFGFYIENLEVSNITIDSVIILWETTKRAQCNILWGKTPEYEKEIISETDFIDKHSVKLESLQVFTKYYYGLECADQLELKANSQAQYFITLNILENPNNFKAVSGDSKITLTWNNPLNIDFKNVIIIKSDSFYPTSIGDGIIVYEGTENFFIDKNLENGKRYYYTIFANYGARGYSAGAIASAIPQTEIVLEPPPEIVFPEPPVAPEAQKVIFKDFDFYLEGTKLAIKNEKTVETENNKVLIVSIDYKKVSDIYKTIIADLEIKGEHFYYLFQLNQEKTIYSTAFLSPQYSDIYSLKIIFLDQDGNKIFETQGELSVYKKIIEPQVCRANNLCQIVTAGLMLLILFLLLILLFLMLKTNKKQSPSQNEKNK